MEETIIILIVIALSFGVFKLIKAVCNPIKTSTAIILIIPTVATCGIALLVYKFFRNTFEIASYAGKSNSKNTNIPYENVEVPKKKKKKYQDHLLMFLVRHLIMMKKIILWGYLLIMVLVKKYSLIQLVIMLENHLIMDLDIQLIQIQKEILLLVKKII